ncbi:MAG: bifunctional folylpolyglutamate synthase/dihydrofolate synthase [Mobilibacterium timonense]|uniref:bifunctional folylpolyglutamate synthase/dihydrofolate synthase n=1 Tax=Mobilibacterium timonense TaxID=1871012 RepID=UPI002355272A|nr:folylpolyglutamate synthase/dihydrofolate synthase family protein [Mobilibacterium timonense]MBM6990961.1 bifunctional folylpolyglutamate synthase/dihydrofolate synthase [Mobilibacterium timonense]
MAMTYDEALDFLNAPKYSETRPGLGPVTELMHRLGDPQDELRYVHITGTNGKGSTSAFVERALREAGYKTGLYTSPYIQNFTERIQVSGKEIPRQELADITEKVKAASLSMLADGMKEPTIFEMVTAVAFIYFYRMKCDIVVLEVGMGGRLDATNIVPRPEVSVITGVAMDHMEFLGDTIADIAFEKAGIIRDGGVTVTASLVPEAMNVIRKTAEEKNSTLVEADLTGIRMLESGLDGQSYVFQGQKISISKLGKYQVRNTALAYTVLEQMKTRWPLLTEDAILKGLEKATWMGRLELLRKDPPFLIDGAHNTDGVMALVESLKDLFPGEKFRFVTGVLKDKDYQAMMSLTEDIAVEYFTVTPDSPRALPAEDLRDLLEKDGQKACSFVSLKEAAFEAWRSEDLKTVAFGSLYYIGALRSILVGN